MENDLIYSRACLVSKQALELSPKLKQLRCTKTAILLRNWGIDINIKFFIQP